MKNRRSKAWKGFTLVELIVVITILAILATIGFLALSGYAQDAKDSAIKANVRSLQTAIVSEAAVTNNSPRYYVTHDAAAALTGAFVFVDGTQTTLTGGASGEAGTNYSAGNPDYAKLKLNPQKFRIGSVANTAFAYDSKDVLVGTMDWSISINGKRRSGNYVQTAGINPTTGKVSVFGNFPTPSTTETASGSALGLIDNPSSPSGTGALVDEMAGVATDGSSTYAAPVINAWKDNAGASQSVKGSVVAITGGYELTSTDTSGMVYFWASNASKSTGKWYYRFSKVQDTGIAFLRETGGTNYPDNFSNWTQIANDPNLLLLADLDNDTFKFVNCTNNATLSTISLPAGKTFFPGLSVHQPAGTPGKSKILFGTIENCSATVPAGYSPWPSN